MSIALAADSSGAGWTAAAIGALSAFLVAVATNFAAYYLQRERLRQELRTEFMAEQALVQLLSHKDWKLRTFDTIRQHVGGFDDEELRRLLVRSGALRFVGDDGKEIWGLRDRNPQRLT